MHPGAERTRVARHIAHAERGARTNERESLTRAQRLVRALLLDELARYRRARRFPKNPGLPHTPIFIDAEGTRCAMAALMELGGASALVDEIAHTRNYDRIAALANIPELVAWLEAAGLTVAEAAAIQPGYDVSCGVTAMCLCDARPGPSMPADGVIEALVTSPYVARVTATYGYVGGTNVGDTLCVDETSPGTTVLVPTPLMPAGVALDTGSAACPSQDVPVTVTLTDARRPAACSQAPLATLPLTKTQAIAALQANECTGMLMSLDDRWGCGCTVSEVGVGLSLEPCATSSSGGCTTSPSSESPATISILLAIVGALAARKGMR